MFPRLQCIRLHRKLFVKDSFLHGVYMIRRLITVSSLIALSACASATKGSTQEVTFYTTGAESAICFIEQEGYRQRIWVPQRVHVARSSHDMTVTCAAPGNREKTIVVGSKVNNSPVVNAWNGVAPGMAVDYETGAMFSYPDTVEIDFSDMEYAQYDLPAYEHVLRNHPEVAGTQMEEFRPGIPALIRDQYEEAPTLRLKTVEPTSGNHLDEVVGISADKSEEKPAVGSLSVSPVAPSSASNSAAEFLTRTMNPQVFDKQ